MSYTLQQTINYAQPFIEYAPLTAGTGNEPAASIASMIRTTILNPPFTWAWNRAIYTALTISQGTQDYVVPLTDFSFLEKLTLKDASGIVYEIKDIYNTNALGLGNITTGAGQRPNAVSIIAVSYGTSVTLRFLGAPDQTYTCTVIYQKLPGLFAAPTDNWAPVPDSFMDIFNNLFLAEALQSADDWQVAAQYRMRGIAALLAKAEGLTEMQKSDFLAQYLSRTSQMLAAQLRTQQGNQARGV